jgi:glutathione S-transferase
MSLHTQEFGLTPDLLSVDTAVRFGGKADESQVAKHAEKAKQGLDVMDAHLSKNQYLVGDQFSLADVFFMPYFALALHTPEATLLTSRPHIAAWWKRVAERASWIKTQTYNEFAQKQ